MSPSLDDLIGARQIEGGNVSPIALADLDVHDQGELRRLLDGQVGRPGASQQPIHVERRSPVDLNQVCAIGHEAAGLRVAAEPVDGGKTMFQGERDDSLRVRLEDGRVSPDQESIDSSACHVREDLVEIAGSLHGYVLELKTEAGGGRLQTLTVPFEGPAPPLNTATRESRGIDLLQEFELLGPELWVQKGEPGDIAARPRQACDESSLDGVVRRWPT